MNKTKVGVIGGGFMGLAHIEALRRLSGVEITAIAEVNHELAKRIALELGIPKAYGSPDDLIRDPEVDVIHNCTPNSLHFEITKAILSAGKHVVSEKPLSMTSKESAELLSLAKTAGKKHAICFNYTCFPMVQQCRSMVARGDLGDIRLVHGGYYQDWLAYDTDYNWRIEPEIGGKSRAVADIGSHWCSVVQYTTGALIEEVFADMSTLIPVRKRPKSAKKTFSQEVGTEESFERVSVSTEDYASVLFKLSNGGRGVFTVSQVSHGCKNKLVFRIDGSKSSAAWDQEEPNQLAIGHRNEANQVLYRDPGLVYPEVRGAVSYPGGHTEGWADGLKNLLKSFYADIHNEPHSFYPTFEQGHYEMLLVDSILKSAQEKVWVKVSQ